MLPTVRPRSLSWYQSQDRVPGQSQYCSYNQVKSRPATIPQQPSQRVISRHSTWHRLLSDYLRYQYDWYSPIRGDIETQWNEHLRHLDPGCWPAPRRHQDRQPVTSNKQRAPVQLCTPRSLIKKQMSHTCRFQLTLALNPLIQSPKVHSPTCSAAVTESERIQLEFSMRQTTSAQSRAVRGLQTPRWNVRTLTTLTLWFHVPRCIGHSTTIRQSIQIRFCDLRIKRRYPQPEPHLSRYHENFSPVGFPTRPQELNYSRQRR